MMGNLAQLGQGQHFTLGTMLSPNMAGGQQVRQIDANNQAVSMYRYISMLEDIHGGGATGEA